MLLGHLWGAVESGTKRVGMGIEAGSKADSVQPALVPLLVMAVVG
jgi:hypothetical protein